MLLHGQGKLLEGEMKLELESGEVYHLHVLHEAIPNPPDVGGIRRVTCMALHSSSCSQEHPCTAPAIVCKAVCHEKDRYVRIAGNKLAFQRVVASFPRPLRGELWRRFWEKHRKPRQ